MTTGVAQGEFDKSIYVNGTNVSCVNDRMFRGISLLKNA